MAVSVFSTTPSISTEQKSFRWTYVGPFSSYAREGIDLVDSDDLKKISDGSIEFQSLLVKGGKVFPKVISTGDGNVEVEFENVDLESFMSVYGTSGRFATAYFTTELEVPEKSRALVFSKGIGGFRINDTVYPADVYGSMDFLTPVILEKGKNKISISARAHTHSGFTFYFIPVKEDVTVNSDITAPDLYTGIENKIYVGIPIINNLDTAIHSIHLKVNSTTSKETVITLRELMPLSAIKLPVAIELTQQKFDKDTYTFSIEVNSGRKKLSEKEFILNVKKPEDPRKETFISQIDDSVQYYGIMFPLNYNPKKDYSLIYTLHGAGVEAIGLVKAYKQNDWAFVAAPTNRRPFGFDWQDWGFLDAKEVLPIIKKKYSNVKDNDIILTGHSMGGHGTYVVGSILTKEFSSIAPGAAWGDFASYFPPSTSKLHAFGDPEIIQVRDIVRMSHSPFTYLENFKNLPVMIYHGRADDNVPFYQGRMFYKYLKHLKSDVEFHEIEGKGHWWNDPETDYTDCVDSPTHHEFWKSNEKSAEKTFPHYFISADLDLNNSSDQFTVIRQIKPLRKTRLVSDLVNNTIQIVTSNVKAFIFKPESGNKPVIIIDEETEKISTLKLTDKKLFLIRDKKGSWKSYSMKSFIMRVRYPSSGYGAKKVFFKPYLLVICGKKDSDEYKKNFERARYYSYSIWLRGNGYVKMLNEEYVGYWHFNSMNMVVFGVPKINSRLKKHYSIAFRKLKEETGISDPQNALVHYHIPKKLNDQNLQQWSESIEPPDVTTPSSVLPGQSFLFIKGKVSGIFIPLYSYAGVPDYVIIGDEPELLWADVKAAGLF